MGSSKWFVVQESVISKQSISLTHRTARFSRCDYRLKDDFEKDRTPYLNPQTQFFSKGTLKDILLFIEALFDAEETVKEKRNRP